MGGICSLTECASWASVWLAIAASVCAAGLYHFLIQHITTLYTTVLGAKFIAQDIFLRITTPFLAQTVVTQLTNWKRNTSIYHVSYVYNGVDILYRSLAKKYHPDANSDADAKEKFQQVVEAWDCLKDEKQRRMYDSYGHEAYDEFRQTGQTGIIQWNMQYTITILCNAITIWCRWASRGRGN